MRIILKKFSQLIFKNQKIGNYNVYRNSTVQDFKNLIAKELDTPVSSFHLEANVYGVKVLLTDSFEFSNFCDESKDTLTVFFEFNTYKDLDTRSSVNNVIQNLVDTVIQGNLVKFQEMIATLDIDGEDLDKRTSLNGWELIHYASLCGREEILKILLENHCNPNSESDDNWTPLLLSCAHAQYTCVHVLLKHPQIQINKVTKRGSALHLAIQYHHIEIVALLLNAKVCCTLENCNGKLPLELASDEDVIQLIPKYIGQWELEKYKKPATVTYSSEFTQHRLMNINDRHVYLVLSLDTGKLEIFYNKEAWSQKQDPIESFKIIDIQKVNTSKSYFGFLKSKFFFEIVFKGGKRIYYTKTEKKRNNWVNKILDSIKYCQLHKVDFGESNLEKLENAPEFENAQVESFQIIEEIGSGSFGTVYKVIKNDSKQIFAMKKLSKKVLTRKKVLKYAISESKIMKELDHPFILSLHYSFECSNYLYLVLEYCPGGDLECLLESGPVSESRARFYLGQIILGLEYLHDHDIVYRDLKPANVLIDSQGYIKLADFGLAKSITDNEEAISTLIGSPAYISPEILCYEKISKASDLYSFGIVMHEILAGVIPFEEFDLCKLFHSIKTSGFTLSKSLSLDAKDLISRMINRKTFNRLSIDKIKNHQFFKGLDWEKLRNKEYRLDSVI
jgi:tRNA A-37 threonylcarbamoyl transferase component Bud32